MPSFLTTNTIIVTLISTAITLIVLGILFEIVVYIKAWKEKANICSDGSSKDNLTVDSVMKKGDGDGKMIEQKINGLSDEVQYLKASMQSVITILNGMKEELKRK